MQNSRYPLILIAIFTLAQLAIIFIFGYTPYPDSEGYILLANECLQHGEPYPVTALLNDYPFLWNIGSINAVVLSLWLFGSITPLLVVYALMKGFTAWLVYDIARLLTTGRRLQTSGLSFTICHLSFRPQTVALLLYVLYPANYGEATSTLGEVPFVCLALLAVWLCLARRWYLVAGMILAVAGWIRPFAIVFFAALLLFFLITKTSKWKRCLHLVAGFVLAVAFIGTLTYARTGLFLYQAKTGWMALTDYSYDHSSVCCDSNATIPQAVRNDTTLTVTGKDRAWRAMFLDWLTQHPAEYFRQMPRKLIDTYATDNVNLCTFLPAKAEREYMYEELSLTTILSHFSPLTSLPSPLTAVQWLTVANLLYYYLLMLLALCSLLYFQSESHLLPVSIIVLGTLMLLLVGHGEARFHQPFMPFVIILSALFIDRWTSDKAHC